MKLMDGTQSRSFVALRRRGKLKFESVGGGGDKGGQKRKKDNAGKNLHVVCGRE